MVGKTVVDNLFPRRQQPGRQGHTFSEITFPHRRRAGKQRIQQHGNGPGRPNLSSIHNYSKKGPGHHPSVKALPVRPSSEEYTDQAIDEISEILRRNHKLKESDDDDFTIRSQQELSTMLTSTTDMMTVLLLAAVAGISAPRRRYRDHEYHVRQRDGASREIGLRMSHGAKGIDILAQFLIESILISVTGGLIGGLWSGRSPLS